MLVAGLLIGFALLDVCQKPKAVRSRSFSSQTFRTIPKLIRKEKEEQYSIDNRMCQRGR